MMDGQDNRLKLEQYCKGARIHEHGRFFLPQEITKLADVQSREEAEGGTAYNFQ